MKKSELLELLKDMAEDTEVNETIQGVEGLTKTFDLNAIGLDQFKNILENNDIAKSYYQSSLDSGIGKGVAAFKEKTLPSIIEEELKKKSNEGKTPEQIKLEELEKKLADMEAEKSKSEMKAKYTKVLSDKGIKSDLIDLIKLSTDNDEENNSTIDKIAELINSSIQEGVKSKFGDNAWTPPNQEVTKDPLLAQLNEIMGVK
jgi:hypothetical protein